jgi:hypothetical protein
MLEEKMAKNEEVSNITMTRKDFNVPGISLGTAIAVEQTTELVAGEKI